MRTDWSSFIPKINQLFQYLTEKKNSSTDDKRLDNLLLKMQSDNYLRKKILEQKKFDYRQAEANFLKITEYKKKHFAWRRAAILLLPLSIAASIFFFYHTKEYDNIQKVAQISLNPRHVYLLTSTQKKYDLSTDTLPSDIEAHVKIGDKTLRYANTNKTDEISAESEPEIHTLVIPRGEEYMIYLPDSTQVWLNSDSRLSYPARFTGNTREVTICGEGYFKVAKQEGKSFIVHTDRGSVIVWGTEFNVEAYKNEDDFVATLVNGSISCTLPNGENIYLQPKEQLIYKVNSTASVQKVDPLLACGWKDGLFVFKNKRMEKITQQIARWFDIKICYMDEAAKDLYFSGDLNKFQDINTFVKIFQECDNLKIWFESDTLYIQSIY
jgi:putative anti-sigma factor